MLELLGVVSLVLIALVCLASLVAVLTEKEKG